MRRAALLAIVANSVACPRDERARRDPTPISDSRASEAHDVAIYEAVLANEVKGPTPTVLYVDRRSLVESECTSDARKIARDAAAYDDWVARNRHSVTLERLPLAPVATTSFLGTAEWEDAFGAKGSDTGRRFRDEHFGKWAGVQFSRVGYDTTQTHAIVAFTFLQGHVEIGVSVYLSREGERWVVVDKRDCWVR